MFVTAIIAAGGSGRRFGGAQPKQLLSIGARTLLERSIAAFATHPAIDEVVVALSSELAGHVPAALRERPADTPPIRYVTGGDRRRIRSPTPSAASAIARISS